MPKKLIGWIVAAFLLFFVITNPAGAAGTARTVGADLVTVGTSVGDFLASLSGGGQ